MGIFLVQEHSTGKKHKHSAYQKIRIYNDSVFNYTSIILFFFWHKDDTLTVRWLIFPTNTNNGEFVVVCHWSTLNFWASSRCVTSSRLVAELGGTILPLSCVLTAPCWLSVFFGRGGGCRPVHAPLSVTSVVIFGFAFSGRQHPSFGCQDLLLTHTGWERPGVLTCPDPTSKGDGLARHRALTPAPRQGYSCSALWFSCQAPIQIRLLKWLIVSLNCRNPQLLRCRYNVPECQSARKHTRIHNLLCPFRDHSAAVVDLLTICFSTWAVWGHSDMLIPVAPEIYRYLIYPGKIHNSPKLLFVSCL